MLKQRKRPALLRRIRPQASRVRHECYIPNPSYSRQTVVVPAVAVGWVHVLADVEPVLVLVDELFVGEDNEVSFASTPTVTVPRNPVE